MIDLRFPLLGERIPGDHAYLLYGALSRLVPEFHQKGSGLRFAPIRGDRFEKGLIQLDALPSRGFRFTFAPYSLVPEAPNREAGFRPVAFAPSG